MIVFVCLLFVCVLIDTIEQNVDTAAVDVEAAGQEIMVAARYQVCV